MKNDNRDSARKGRFRAPFLKGTQDKENKCPEQQSQQVLLERGQVTTPQLHAYFTSEDGTCSGAMPETSSPPFSPESPEALAWHSLFKRRARRALSTSSESDTEQAALRRSSGRGGSELTPKKPSPRKRARTLFSLRDCSASSSNSEVNENETPNGANLPPGVSPLGNNTLPSNRKSLRDSLNSSDLLQRVPSQNDNVDVPLSQTQESPGSAGISPSTGSNVRLRQTTSKSSLRDKSASSSSSEVNETPDDGSNVRLGDSPSGNKSPLSNGGSQRGSPYSNDLSERVAPLNDNDDHDDLPPGQDQESPGTADAPSKTRKKVRVRQTTSKSRLETKLARNKGEEYVTTSGKVIPKKVAAPLEKCRSNCKDKIGMEDASELCDSVWKNLGDANLRRSYISGQIHVNPKKSMSLKGPSKKNRQFTFTYHACVKGINIVVCKICFKKLYQVTSKFIEISVGDKLKNPGGVQSKDMRGASSHSSVSNSNLDAVIDHINSFPRYKSHYGRNKTDKEFLASHLSLKIMYEEYCSKIEEPNTAVSRWVYEREFHALGLQIKPLKIDTCHTCDTLEMSIRYAKSDEEKEDKILKRDVHQASASIAIDQKRNDKQKAKEDQTVETVAFDLQQCLPTPHISSSIVFYLRQLWVYNLTIHIMSNDTSIHNMWHEGEGGRGANQVGSALYRFILNLPDCVEQLILWSDTCAGQNKNSVINSALISAMKEKKTLKMIDQKFLVSGHTHLECDTDHAVIEEKKKRAQEIHIPRDWFNLVRGASQKFTVQLLNREHQFDFKILTSKTHPLVKRKVTTNKEKFVWKDVVWLQHRRDLPSGVIAFKKSFKEEEEFSLLDMRRRKRGELVLPPLQRAYEGPNLISVKKKKDLLSLLHLIDPDCHAFYRSLVTSDTIPENIDDDIIPNSDVEESEEE